jgi:hypothetical protein
MGLPILHLHFDPLPNRPFQFATNLIRFGNDPNVAPRILYMALQNTRFRESKVANATRQRETP